MRLEFENGFNSRSKAVFACQHRQMGISFDFMIYVEGKSFLGFLDDPSKIFEAMADPRVIYWKISNSKKFLRELDVRKSISCEKITFAYNLFKK